MKELLNALTPERLWIIFGFVAQAIFGSAFLIQWLVSEKHKRSQFPISFWYLRIIGSVMLFVVALQMWKSTSIAVVAVFGYSANCLVYVRNLVLIYRRRALIAAGHVEPESWEGP